MEFLSQLSRQVKELYGRLTTSQKIAFVLLMALVAVVMVWFTATGTGGEYVTLSAQPRDAAERATTMSALGRVGIDAREENGMIQVATGQQARAMAVLAESGTLPTDFSAELRLPDVSKNGGIFDTPAERQARRDLALQNWLADVIRNMEGIAQATVAFDTPQALERVLADEKGTASVVVWLKNKGGRLTGEQVRGIAALISGARRTIPTENVQIVDGAGHAYRVMDNESLGGQVAQRQQQELAYEEGLAKKVEELLSPYLGPNVKALVNASIDYDQEEVKATEYGSEGVATHTRTTTSETPATGNGGTQTPPTTEEEREATYVVPETNRKTVKAPGRVTDLGVTALVPREGIVAQLQGENLDVTGAALNGLMSAKVDEIQEMVMTGLGITDRSKVVVKAVSFPRIEIPAPPAEPSPVVTAWERYGTAMVLGVLTVLAVALIWKVVSRPVEVNVTRGSDLGVVGEEELLSGLGMGETGTLRTARMEEKVREMTAQNPQEAAGVIRRWLHTEG